MISEISNLPEEAKPLVSQLAEKIGSHANAAMVYAAPVERDGVTVIPIAKVRFGFGGGGGGNQQQGSGGGGGGAIASPVGYIEMTAGGTRFRPIFDATAIASVVVACGFTGVLLLRGLRKLSTRTKQAM